MRMHTQKAFGSPEGKTVATPSSLLSLINWFLLLRSHLDHALDWLRAVCWLQPPTIWLCFHLPSNSVHVGICSMIWSAIKSIALIDQIPISVTPLQTALAWAQQISYKSTLKTDYIYSSATCDTTNNCSVIYTLTTGAIQYYTCSIHVLLWLIKILIGTTIQQKWKHWLIHKSMT